MTQTGGAASKRWRRNFWGLGSTKNRGLASWWLKPRLDGGSRRREVGLRRLPFARTQPAQAGFAALRADARAQREARVQRAKRQQPERPSRRGFSRQLACRPTPDFG